jgi:hypothetical protein
MEVRSEMRNQMHGYVSNSPDDTKRPYSLTVLSVPEVPSGSETMRRERATADND